MNNFTVALSDLKRIGSGLKRPECVAVTAAGAVWVSHSPSDGGRGVARILTDGRIDALRAKGGPSDLLPNGWSMEPKGSFVLANLGDSGGVWRLTQDGACTPVLLEVDGHPISPVNFVHRDEQGRLWISVSTWRIPRDRAFHRDVADGHIILLDDHGARIVADGLGFSNEVKVNPSNDYLYVNETLARRLSRYAITGSRLGPRETVVDYIDGIIPDGFEFDAEGGVWCTSVMSNRLVRVAPDRSQHIILEDCDATEIQAGMDAWHANEFTREHMNIGAHHELKNISSITFGGPDLKTVYLGSLFGDSIVTFRSPIAGTPPPHWHF